jgi:hypothetical protein
VPAGQPGGQNSDSGGGGGGVGWIRLNGSTLNVGSAVLSPASSTGLATTGGLKNVALP